MIQSLRKIIYITISTITLLVLSLFNSNSVFAASCGVAVGVVGHNNGVYQVAVNINTTGLVPGHGYEIKTFNNSFANVFVANDTNNYVAGYGVTLPPGVTSDQVYITEPGENDPLCVSDGTFVYDPTNLDEVPGIPTISNVITSTTDLCEQAGTPELVELCKSCGAGQIWTAVGCIPTDASGITSRIFTVGLGLAGGFALLFILFGAFTITTSTGNPEKVKSGQEMITAAIFGLLFIIFSTVILQLIGVSILQIPGF